MRRKTTDGVKTATVALLLLLLATGPTAGAAGAPGDEGWTETFDPGWQDRWQVTPLARRGTRFEARSFDGNRALVAIADRAAGALIRPVASLRAATVSWRWNVQEPLDSPRDETARAGDDFAARFFVIFGEDLMDGATTALCYVWSRGTPPGSEFVSPSVDRVRTIVLRGPEDGSKAWRSERIEPAADYRRAFGVEPPPIGAIGLMSDGDDTDALTVAAFDDIVVSSR